MWILKFVIFAALIVHSVHPQGRKSWNSTKSDWWCLWQLVRKVTQKQVHLSHSRSHQNPWIAEGQAHRRFSAFVLRAVDRASAIDRSLNCWCWCVVVFDDVLAAPEPVRCFFIIRVDVFYVLIGLLLCYVRILDWFLRKSVCVVCQSQWLAEGHLTWSGLRTWSGCTR